MTDRDLTQLRPEELTSLIANPPFYVKDDFLNVGQTAALKEMERRLKEVDNCICWGVGCVHQAKELDRSYRDYNLLEHMKNQLEAALKKYVPQMGDKVCDTGSPELDAAWQLACEVRRTLSPHPKDCPCRPCADDRERQPNT